MPQQNNVQNRKCLLEMIFFPSWWQKTCTKATNGRNYLSLECRGRFSLSLFLPHLCMEKLLLAFHCLHLALWNSVSLCHFCRPQNSFKMLLSLHFLHLVFSSIRVGFVLFLVLNINKWWWCASHIFHDGDR